MTAGGNPKTGKTEILYRSSTEWMNFSPLNEAISGHQAVFTNDAVFVTGGYNGKIRKLSKIIRIIKMGSYYNTIRVVGKVSKFKYHSKTRFFMPVQQKLPQQATKLGNSRTSIARTRWTSLSFVQPKHIFTRRYESKYVSTYFLLNLLLRGPFTLMLTRCRFES